MNRLFLASSGLGYIKEFTGAEPASPRMLFIPTAGNLDQDVWWIDKDRDVLAKTGFRITELDIAQATVAEQSAALQATDIVYVAGGNTFYLLKQMQDSGFAKLLTEYVNNGGLYAGASAGALIAGADIGPISQVDEPEKVTGLQSTEGLGFIDIVPVPHYDMKARTKTIDEIKARYNNDFEIVLMTDDQAVLVEGDTWKLVDSKRSELELDWFRKNHQDV